MLPDRVSNQELLTYESGALPIALRSPVFFSDNSELGNMSVQMICLFFIIFFFNFIFLFLICMCDCSVLLCCFEFSGSLRQLFSLYRAFSQREGERKEINDR